MRLRILLAHHGLALVRRIGRACPLGLLVLGTVQAAEPLRLRATPLLSEQVQTVRKPATFVTGEQFLGRDGVEATLQGAAELRRPGLVLKAERIHYDQATDVVTVQGDGRLIARGDRYSAPEGQLQVDAMTGFLLQPSYRFLDNAAHGQAERIDFEDAERITVLAGSYTTCARPDPDDPDWQPDWMLRADQLEIDREEETGLARGGVLEFKGVPILPLPAVRFPLSGQRLSGWLPPTIGLDSKSGLELSVPWYWNIAPQRDATLTPTLMARRGVDLGGEFRYLENDYQGRANLNLMPHDRLRGRSRWGLHARHQGHHDTGLESLGRLGLALNLNRVSDQDYWRDFTRRSDPALTSRLLPSEGSLNWARGDWSASLRAQAWQTLQDVASPIVPPYDRLPQLVARWTPAGSAGLDYGLRAEYTRFRADRALTGQPNARRSVLHARIERPWLRPWGFVRPRLQLHATHYDFDRPVAGGRNSASRVLPTFSLDSGLVFERPASYFGRAFTQTLEPRLMYVYTPYRDQSHLPNYDSGSYDFNFATIWSENAFAGQDRIVDNRLVTAGLTSRLLDPQTGAEALRLSVAQRYRFAPQRVTLPGGAAADRGVSDLMLGAGISWDPRWSFDTVLQYNPDTRRSTRTTVHGRYSPGPYRTVSVAYRQQRDLGSEHLDLGWQWPLDRLIGARGELGRSSSGAGGSCRGRWYSVGRLNYSLRDSKLVDSILGLEYDAGCWIGRLVFEKLQSSVTSSTKRVVFQLEFVGLSRLGSSSLRTLQEHIPRYQMLRHDQPTPSRFTDYE